MTRQFLTSLVSTGACAGCVVLLVIHLWPRERTPVPAGPSAVTAPSSAVPQTAGVGEVPELPALRATFKEAYRATLEGNSPPGMLEALRQADRGSVDGATPLSELFRPPPSQAEEAEKNLPSREKVPTAGTLPPLPREAARVGGSDGR